MGIAKKFLSLAVCFLCFVGGLFVLLDALCDLNNVEATKLTWVIEDGNDINIETIEDGPVSGSRIVALLLLPLDCEVKLNGNNVMTGNTVMAMAIDIQKQYWFKREYEENLSKPTLVITEYVEE